ncbi:hypothetical protein [Nitrosomonas supralitoralis]|uniref:Uncharacterized protein n=1 Tax=Nitrosomonas supralitoralis TaxID=2116706 RepID=A0A2P7NUP2_9PROT|nr:hypothetical protein [Nitrosomonas supralitoralis]PSJ17158.1 hypothetical protein C7H79_09655 [Nitrosomonas supralitoralis]
MSQEQINATTLLCRLLERNKAEINGTALREGEQKSAAELLLKERILVSGNPHEWITCPECRIETARVVRETSADQILLLCPECEDFEAPRYHRETHKVPLQKFIHLLLNGLNLSINGLKQIEPDLVWRLGTTEEKRGKMLTWYFARCLYRPEIANRLRDQIILEKTQKSCLILTSGEVPLPVGSALTEFDVRPLFTVGQIGSRSFEFYPDRQSAPGAQILDEATPGTTLRYVRNKGKVYIDGREYLLEPMQQRILSALIDDRDHEMDKEAIKTACGSESQRFSPSKAFDKDETTKLIYRTFIRFLPEDDRYSLIIPNDDRDWLI